MAASLPAGLNLLPQPSRRVSSSSSSPSPATTVALRSAPEDVQKEVEEEIRNLHSENHVVVAKAAAALVMLAALPGAEPYLRPSVSRLSLLLENVESIHVQRNACAALTAIMNASLSLYMEVAKSPYLMERLLQCLENQDGDSGLQINVAAALSFLAHSGEGLEIIKITDADIKLLSLLEHTHDVRLQEEISDAICALAVHEEMRDSLVEKVHTCKQKSPGLFEMEMTCSCVGAGAVSRLASKLTTGSPEICVRALLGLGMLCGSSQEAQEHFAETDGAIATLLSLMKSNDQDIRAIARDLCGALSLNEQVKPVIEQLLRSSSASRAI